MKRLVSALLAVVGGGIAAYAVTLGAAGALLGILWLYVFGDDPWPAWTNTILGLIIVVAGLALWVFFTWIIWLQLVRRA